MTQIIKGTGVALVTPFTIDGSVDYTALKQLVLNVTNGGVDFLVALGTTAESVTLTLKEKQDVLSAIVSYNAQKLPVVCGIGGNNTAEIVDQLNTFNLQGVSAILTVTPYYNKPTQAGLYEHFKTIARATKLPIILYNVPGRTGCNLLPETVCKLAVDCQNIVAIKEASGNMVQCMELLRTKPTNFIVLSGDDNLVLAQMAMGMEGIISVAANSFPTEMSKIVNLALESDYDKARNLLYKLLPGIDLLFIEGNPAGVKCALHQQGLCQNILRLPLVPVSSNTAQKMAEFIKNVTFL